MHPTSQILPLQSQNSQNRPSFIPEEANIQDLETQVAVSADAMTSHMNKSLGRGQWPPRIVIALTLWYQDNLVELGKLFNTWYYQFRELKSLVDKKLEKHLP